jgi:hypothetical protein
MERKHYLNEREKGLDFILGFLGLVPLNAVIYLLFARVGAVAHTVDYGPGQVGEIVRKVVGYAAAILPWVINIGLFGYCAWWRPWIAIGALSALALPVALSILAGMCFIAGCLLFIGASWLIGLVG